MCQPARMLHMAAVLAIVQCEFYFGSSQLAGYPQSYYSNLSPTNDKFLGNYYYPSDTDGRQNLAGGLTGGQLQVPPYYTQDATAFRINQPYLGTYGDNYNPSITSSSVSAPSAGAAINLASVQDTSSLYGPASVVHFPYDPKGSAYQVPSSSSSGSQPEASPNVVIQSTGKNVYVRDLTLRLPEPVMNKWLESLIVTMKGASCALKPAEKKTKFTLFVQPLSKSDTSNTAGESSANDPEIQVHNMSGHVDVGAVNQRASPRNAYNANFFNLGDESDVVTFDPLNTPQP